MRMRAPIPSRLDFVPVSFSVDPVLRRGADVLPQLGRLAQCRHHGVDAAIAVEIARTPRRDAPSPASDPASAETS